MLNRDIVRRLHQPRYNTCWDFPMLKKDKEYIRNEAARKTARELSEELNYSPDCIRRICRQNNVKCMSAKNKEWSKEEIDYLIANYGILPVNTILSQIQRSLTSIRVKVTQLRKEGYNIASYNLFYDTRYGKVR